MIIFLPKLLPVTIFSWASVIEKNIHSIDKNKKSFYIILKTIQNKLIKFIKNNSFIQYSKHGYYLLNKTINFFFLF